MMGYDVENLHSSSFLSGGCYQLKGTSDLLSVSKTHPFPDGPIMAVSSTKEI